MVGDWELGIGDWGLGICNMAARSPTPNPQPLIPRLAPRPRFWQVARMEPARNNQAGGFVLAACIIGGTVAGAILRQPSLGFLIGLGAGILLALAIWVVDRSR
jgi:hypothetical protein